MKKTLGATSGLPGQINLICSEFLTAGMFEEIGIDLVGQPRVGVAARIAGWDAWPGARVHRELAHGTSQRKRPHHFVARPFSYP